MSEKTPMKCPETRFGEQCQLELVHAPPHRGPYSQWVHLQGCTSPSPRDGSVCELPHEHDGPHAVGAYCWGATPRCRAVRDAEFGALECELTAGHVGPHGCRLPGIEAGTPGSLQWWEAGLPLRPGLLAARDAVCRECARGEPLVDGDREWHEQGYCHATPIRRLLAETGGPELESPSG